jgi:hypothetical protein
MAIDPAGIISLTIDPAMIVTLNGVRPPHNHHTFGLCRVFFNSGATPAAIERRPSVRPGTPRDPEWDVAAHPP